MLQICSRDKVLNVFFLEPSKKHYLKEISKKIKIAHTSVKKILNELLKEKIIIEETERKGKRSFPLFYSNLENENFKNLKRLNNLKGIYDSRLIEYLEEFMPKLVVLFGSYFRGEDIEDSDIDFFVEMKESEVDLKKFEKKLGRKINILFEENFNTLPGELKENIINGIVLQGVLELK
jgi:predicted nucleotidyltransferase